MSYKWATYISLSGIIVLAVVFLSIASGWNLPSNNPGEIGSSYFPNGLSIILLILCLISFIQTLRKKEDIKIEFPHLKMIFITILLIGLFLIGWSVLKLFYISLFLFMMSIFIIYQPKEQFKKKIIPNLAITIVIMLIVYTVFDRYMMLDF